MNELANELVKKSVRLPADLVEYVEGQKGRDFSKKLVSILWEAREGDRERQRILDEYDALIEKRRARLEELQQEIYRASVILRKVSGVEDLTG